MCPYLSVSVLGCSPIPRFSLSPVFPKPYAQQLDMAHPARMKAITAGKKKSDRLDARTIADLLRCNLLPACYVLSPERRDLRRRLRYRQLVVAHSPGFPGFSLPDPLDIFRSGLVMQVLSKS